MRLSGGGRDRRPLATCVWEAGRQCRGGSTNSCRADQPTRQSETALPDSPAIKGRITPAGLPAGITTPGKCASHLDFGLGYGVVAGVADIPLAPAVEWGRGKLSPISCGGFLQVLFTALPYVVLYFQGNDAGICGLGGSAVDRDSLDRGFDPGGEVAVPLRVGKGIR